MSKNVIKKIIQRLEEYAQDTDVYESYNIINKKDERGAYDMQTGDLSITEGDNFIGNYCDIESIHIIYSWKLRENKEEKE